MVGQPGEVTDATRLQTRLDRLGALNLGALRQQWRRAFGRSAPEGLSRTLLHRMLAYQIQADALGDLDRETIRALDRMGQGGPMIPIPDRRGGKPGTLLVREWQGTMHSVMVLKEGYAWNGSTYRSLSEVALAITGTKWSGPRFFGLKRGRAA